MADEIATASEPGVLRHASIMQLSTSLHALDLENMKR